MNPLPSLPTDNLYKFCAISGLVIVIFVGYTTWQKWSDLRQRGEAIEAEAEAMKLSVGWWQTLERERSEALKTLAKSDPTMPTIVLNGDPIPRDQFWNYLDNREKEIETGRLKTVDSVARFGKIVSLQQEMIWMLWVAGGSIAFGLLLMGYGFWNWRAIQLKQDTLLRDAIKEVAVHPASWQLSFFTAHRPLP